MSATEYATAAVDAAANAKLTITDLRKRYGSTVALNGVNLTLRPAIYGLFGRNGAGKSTLMGIIANRLLPSGGSIELDGAGVFENEVAQSRIYLLNETVPFMVGVRLNTIFKREERYYGGFDWALSARMLAEFGIMPGSLYGQLSLGQRMIVRLVAALCVPVDVLLLDEPVLGLDAANRELFYKFLLESFGDYPRIIVLSTHIISEIAHVVERVAILDQGKIIDEFDAESVGSRATVLVGEADQVTTFAASNQLQIISREEMGKLLSVVVRGQIDSSELPAGVSATRLDLQEYVIRATSSPETQQSDSLSTNVAGFAAAALPSQKGQ
ncbi:ATP-binding cassette domain-containing protein [Bifidobacterium felsineum]|uniref:Multidrug ABC transporter ATP-binding protein n=1 Tax=Bifidobacterium felsineum TaxID=2045440 RepID=A0A2M9HJC4_9BIFI|nr:ABC transporter ATP-binding protein [Bifidobacterium felsineum]PJM76914.1 multidrug ABC transporter ATP-binding protein [Bifidobacterium felsineum]